MTKAEFIERIKKENIRPDEYLIVLDKITDAPLVLGCVLEDNKWKVYQTKERTGHFIIEEFNSENDAFDFFYETILFYS
ncbi:hypothetical protein [Rummeliibacillus stabekisii]|uniref:hypothetical protein n=1 Tax=Rummeliibacillus stabekisii TaxID=241244 RepID=UPI003712038B